MFETDFLRGGKSSNQTSTLQTATSFIQVTWVYKFLSRNFLLFSLYPILFAIFFAKV